MPTPIPVYPLHSFTGPGGQPAGVFFLGPGSAVPRLPIDRPYRSNYYKIGLMLRGHATLRLNLDTYELAPGSLLLLPPEIIKQWGAMSPGHESLSVFFTQEFITAASGLHLARFPFFAPEARPILALSPAQAAPLEALLRVIQQRHDSPHDHRDEILRSLLHILLHETAPIYGQHCPTEANAALTRGQLIASQFKQLVGRHHTRQRSLGFYADQLCITPKHLTATVKEATGKRAAEWIAEAVVLEAKVLLQHPAATVAQVAEQLSFPDQSAFGRFFRSHAGVSPVAYRQRG